LDGCDDFVKSPISLLRCIPRHYDVLLVRIILRDLRRLELELFTLSSLTFSENIRFYALRILKINLKLKTIANSNNQ